MRPMSPLCRAPGEAQKTGYGIASLKEASTVTALQETPAMTTNFTNCPAAGPKGQKSLAQASTWVALE